MAGKKKVREEDPNAIACDEIVTLRGESKGKATDVSEETASKAARQDARDNALADAKKQSVVLENQFYCGDKDCLEMVVLIKRKTSKPKCKEVEIKDKNTGLTENGFECKCTCKWKITIECEEE